MIDDELKELIKPYLKIYMDKRDWIYIDDMFEEAYVANYEGNEIISLKPHPHSEDISIQFYVANGAYYSIDYWENVKKKGTRV